MLLSLTVGTDQAESLRDDMAETMAEFGVAAACLARLELHMDWSLTARAAASSSTATQVGASLAVQPTIYPNFFVWLQSLSSLPSHCIADTATDWFQALSVLQRQLQPQYESHDSPACTDAGDLLSVLLCAALNSQQLTSVAPRKVESLPSAILQHLRHKAQRSGTRTTPRMQLLQPSSGALAGSAVDAESYVGAQMAALDEQHIDDGTSGAELPSGTATACDRRHPGVGPAAQPAVPEPDMTVGCNTARAPAATGVFARREKRRAEADRKRRAKRGARPDGGNDLSFFLQLRKPGDAGAAFEGAEPDSDAEASADSFTDALLGGSGTPQQPQV